MNVRNHSNPARHEHGMSVIELLIALVVLSVGLIAVARMFPTGARAQVQDRLLMGANYYAQEQMETLTNRSWSDPLLTEGRHPAGSATEALGHGQWQRWYQVTTMTGSLSNLKKVDVTVSYSGAGRSARTVTATTYVRR
jgi:prepilin-type N-terminal cleavage/methylation domain-containing protein